jgi:hypothetical protein
VINELVDGNGNGNGNGYGDGNGDGYGNGNGDGNGYGYGYGFLQNVGGVFSVCPDIRESVSYQVILSTLTQP